MKLGYPTCIYSYPRHPVIFSADDWGVQSPPQHSIWVPLPFSEGDWIPRVNCLQIHPAMKKYSTFT